MRQLALGLALQLLLPLAHVVEGQLLDGSVSKMGRSWVGVSNSDANTSRCWNLPYCYWSLSPAPESSTTKLPVTTRLSPTVARMYSWQ